jgi:hypothetical protein
LVHSRRGVCVCVSARVCVCAIVQLHRTPWPTAVSSPEIARPLLEVSQEGCRGAEQRRVALISSARRKEALRCVVTHRAISQTPNSSTRPPIPRLCKSVAVAMPRNRHCASNGPNVPACSPGCGSRTNPAVLISRFESLSPSPSPLRVVVIECQCVISEPPKSVRSKPKTRDVCVTVCVGCVRAFVSSCARV